MDLTERIAAVRGGDLAAYADVVAATRDMVYATVRRVIADPEEARDLVQETYLRAYRGLGSLREDEAFPGWLRRVAVTTAQNAARSRRFAFLGSRDVPDVPVLDEAEESWTAGKLAALSGALLTLDGEDRRLCERHYHGGESLDALANEIGITPAAMRKRMQRIRDKLRKEIEMSEARDTREQPASSLRGMPARIVELLAKPRLLGLPDNPVARMWELVKPYFPGYTEVELPEMLVDEEVRRELGLPQSAVAPLDITHRVDDRRFLRADLTNPMLLVARSAPRPQRLMAAGKVYRDQSPTPTRVQMFHQAEFLHVGTHDAAPHFSGTMHRVAQELFPGTRYRVQPVTFPHVCEKAWELDVERDGSWLCILSWGFFTPEITRVLGHDPGSSAAVGAAFGLERMACLYFGIDDVRKVEAVSV
jgi:RNA polymerase sigma-70 factor (ECF subfamily)